MSGRLAAIILAHDNARHVRRLIAALDGVDLFLHCDRRASDSVLAEMLAGAPGRVHVLPRRRADLFGWSLVAAELAALREALARSSAEHLIVMSGSCYPLVSVAELEAELEPWRGRSRLGAMPLPWSAWDTPRHPDGGLWRVNRRFVAAGGRVVRVGGMPLRTRRRAMPRGLRLHGADQWKVYAREHARSLLEALDADPALVAFWRHSFVPDELCVPSILASPELVGEAAETIDFDRVWQIDWVSGGAGGAAPIHPRWLSVHDIDALEAARDAPARRPGDAPGEGYRKLFARKLPQADGRLTQLIDERLRR